MMKIGITCYPTFGGSGAVATELGLQLADRGHEIHFISYAQPFRLIHFHEGLFFHEVEVTAEKREGDYHRLIEQHAIARETSWMVGNSVRSDINPALKAGLGAVFIPHPQTWTLEHEEVDAEPGARLEILEKFSELLRLFQAKTFTKR